MQPLPASSDDGKTTTKVPFKVSFSEFSRQEHQRFANSLGVTTTEASDLLVRFRSSFEAGNSQVSIPFWRRDRKDRCWLKAKAKAKAEVEVEVEAKAPPADLLLHNVHLIGHLLGGRAVSIARTGSTRLAVLDFDAHGVGADRFDALYDYREAMERLGWPPHVLMTSPRGLHTYLAFEQWYPVEDVERALRQALRMDDGDTLAVEIRPNGSQASRLPGGPKWCLLDGERYLDEHAVWLAADRERNTRGYDLNAAPAPVPAPLAGARIKQRFSRWGDARGWTVHRNLAASLPLLLDLIERARLPSLDALSPPRHSLSPSIGTPSTPPSRGVPSIPRRMGGRGASKAPSRAPAGSVIGVKPSSSTHEQVHQQRMAGSSYDRMSETARSGWYAGRTREEVEADLDDLLATDPKLLSKPAWRKKSLRKQALKHFDKLVRRGRPRTQGVTGSVVALSIRVEQASATGNGWRVQERTKCPPTVLAAMAGEADWLVEGVTTFAGLLSDVPRGGRITINHAAMKQVVGNLRHRHRLEAVAALQGEFSATPPSLTRATIDFLVRKGWLLFVKKAEPGHHAAVYLWLPPQPEKEIA